MARKRGSRFRKAIDAQEQLEGLEEQQQLSRKRKAGPLIERIDKTKNRFNNAVKRLKKRSDISADFES